MFFTIDVIAYERRSDIIESITPLFCYNASSTLSREYEGTYTRQNRRKRTISAFGSPHFCDFVVDPVGARGSILLAEAFAVGKRNKRASGSAHLHCVLSVVPVDRRGLVDCHLFNCETRDGGPRSLRVLLFSRDHALIDPPYFLRPDPDQLPPRSISDDDAFAWCEIWRDRSRSHFSAAADGPVVPMGIRRRLPDPQNGHYHAFRAGCLPVAIIRPIPALLRKD